LDKATRSKKLAETTTKANKKRKRLEKQAATRKAKKTTLVDQPLTRDPESGDGDDPDADLNQPPPPPIKPPAEKVITIRLFPTLEQATTLKSWIGTARFCYNTALGGVLEENVSVNKQALRDFVLNNNQFKRFDLMDWLQDVPYDVRRAAVDELFEAYQSNFAKWKLNPTHTFKMAFRKKKGPGQEGIVIHYPHIRLLPLPVENPVAHCRTQGQLVIYPGSLGKEPILSAEPIPADALNYDCRITRDRLGHFYLLVPRPLNPQPLPESLPSVIRNPTPAEPASRLRIASLDPGVRTFMTIFDVHGQLALEWGKGDMGLIARLLHHLDRLQSKRDHMDTRARQRYRLNRAMERVRQRVRNLVDDCHHRLAKFLCESYDHILIPVFETSKMSRKATRKIDSETVRSMLTWSHYRFRTLLTNKAREYPWVKVHMVTEEYTSKTCTGCGHLKNNLGGAKVYDCSACQSRWDRDVAGARNIYLKKFEGAGTLSQCLLCPGTIWLGNHSRPRCRKWTW